MRGKKHRRRGKTTLRELGNRSGRHANFPSQNRQEFEEDFKIEEEAEAESEAEAERESKSPSNQVEREGNLAVNLLTRKIQLRKIVHEMKLKTEDDDEDEEEDDDGDGDYIHESDDRHPCASSNFEEGLQRKLESRHNEKEAEGSSFKNKGARRKRKTKPIKEKPKFIEDEEVLRIIGELEKEVDTFPELLGIDESLEQSDALPNKMDVLDVETEVTKKCPRKKIEIKFEDVNNAPKTDEVKNAPKTDEVNNAPKTDEKPDVMTNKKVGGLINQGPYSRILVVGDCRLKSLESCWPEYAYIKPQFLVEPKLQIDDLVDFILSQTDLPELKNGTLLMCSMGLHDIIDFKNYRACLELRNHRSMKIMTLKVNQIEDLIKIVLMKFNRACQVLEHLLDSSSVVCFTPIIPCDPLDSFASASKNHSPSSHAIMTSDDKESLFTVKDKIKQVCERVNKHLKRASPLPSLWEIMSTYDLDKQIISHPFIDGVNISRETAKSLSIKLNRFFQELFLGVKINNHCLEFSQNHKVIVVGDSRLLELEKVWVGDKPTFCCEPELGFYNFKRYIKKNFAELNNKVVLVCLGLHDLVKFVDNEECVGKDHEPNKVIVPLYEENKAAEIVKNIIGRFESFISTFCSCMKSSSLLIFATLYPIDLATYMASQVKAHEAETKHAITIPVKNPESNETLNEIICMLNSHLRLICKKQSLPIWDMCHVVCRGQEASSLDKSVLRDGIYPSERTAEELIRSYFNFVKGKLKVACVETKSGYKFPFRALPKYVAKEDSDRKAVQQITSYSQSTESSRYSDIEAEKRKSSRSVHKKHQSRWDERLDIKSHERLSRSPERLHTSRSKSRERLGKSQHSRSSCPWSPDQNRTSRLYRSPERRHRSWGPYNNFEEQHLHGHSEFDDLPLRGHSEFENRPLHGHSEFENQPLHVHSAFEDHRYERHSKSQNNPQGIFIDSIKIIKKQCQKEGNAVMREALLDLCDTHSRECERYLDKPDAHQDYKKEYWLFLERKKNFIVELGGDPKSYDYLTEWGQYWPIRMIELFRESWELKKVQCLSMISSKRKRFSSSSSSSSSSTSSSCSSYSSSTRRKKKHSKRKSKHLKSVVPEFNTKGKTRDRDKWIPLGSSTGSEEELIREMIPERKIYFNLRNEMSEPSFETQTLQSIQEGIVSKHAKDKPVKVLEVLRILTYMKDKLGGYGTPVSMLYEKAVSFQKKGFDPNLLLQDKEAATLLSMLNDKLVTMLQEKEGSAIQRAIILEGQALLKDLIERKINRSEATLNVGQMACSSLSQESSLAHSLNIDHLAHLTMGKSIPETITIIKNFMIYEGLSDISKERLESIYVAVKDEQLKINNTACQLQGQYQQGSEMMDRSRAAQLHKNYNFPRDELTEEFFIGQKLSSKLGPAFSKPSAAAEASTSKFDSSLQLDEEFFTGRRFMKPSFSDPVSKTRASNAEKGFYMPHKHVLPPPPPVISGIQCPSSSFLSFPNEPKTPSSNLDFDMMRKCLATLKHFPK